MHSLNDLVRVAQGANTDDPREVVRDALAAEVVADHAARVTLASVLLDPTYPEMYAAALALGEDARPAAAQIQRAHRPDRGRPVSTTATHDVAGHLTTYERVRSVLACVSDAPLGALLTKMPAAATRCALTEEQFIRLVQVPDGTLRTAAVVTMTPSVRR